MQRRHDIDALRALAFGLLILYHLAMLYVTDWGWHLKSNYLTEALQMPMLMLNRWRMDLIFLISGISTAFLMKNSRVAGFLKDRTWRLMLPLIFGMLVVVPIQPYAQGVANGLVEPGFLRFLARYYTGATWPEKAFDGWEHGFTWNHLWYLAYLWCYTLVLPLLLPLLNSRMGKSVRNAFTGLRGLPLLLLPAVPLFVYTVTLQARFPDTHDLVHDWYVHPMYFTIFLYGWCLANSDGLWAELTAKRKLSLGLALACGAAYFALVRFYWGVEDVSTEAQWLIWAVRNVYVWSTLCAILGWGHALPEPPHALAALGHAGRLPLVRAPPEFDRAARVLAGAAEDGSRGRTLAGGRRHGAGLLGADVWVDSAGRMDSAAVWLEGAEVSGS